MSEGKINIEFEKETLESIFKEAGMNMPANPSADDIKDAISEMKESLSFSKPEAKETKKEETKEPDDKKPEAKEEPEKVESPSDDIDDVGAASAEEQKPMDEIEFNGKNVLVVDDLGVVNYQLSCLLKREGFRVQTTTNLPDAIDYFKTKRVDIVILDLFLPSEREGILLLEELVKIKQSINKDCKIVMMTSDSKSELKKLCKSIGAHKFIEKAAGWHEKIVEECI